MTDRILHDACRRIAQTLQPRDELMHQKVVRETVKDDRSISSQALQASLPWTARDVIVHGTPAAGKVARLEYPQGGVLRRVALHAATAPTGTGYSVRVDVDGLSAGTFSIPAGQTSGGGNVTTPIDEGKLVEVVVLEVNGSAGITTTVFASVKG